MMAAGTTRAAGKRRSPAHSVTFTPELREEVTRYARRHNLNFGAAVRALVTDQLRLERLRRAQEWQIAQAWAEVQAIERGDWEEASWAEIEAAHREALRVAERKQRRRVAS